MGQLSQKETDDCFNARNATGAACCLGRCVPSRGVCIRGVCNCHKEWRGFDCTEPLKGPEDGGSSGGGGGRRGFVYVHAPPPELGLENMLRFQCKKNSYDADWHLVRRLLRDRSAHSVRLADASLFYVPTWAAFSWGNRAARKYGWVVDRLVSWLRGSEFAEHWTANRSRYIFYFTADMGACGVPAYGTINLAHWGLTSPWDMQLKPHQYMPNASAVHPCPADQSVQCLNKPPCFTQRRDVSMPLYSAWSPTLSTNSTAAAAAGSAPPPPPPLPPPEPGAWQCELYFAGSFAHAFAPMYSQGVRQAVRDAHENRSGYCIHRKAPDLLWYRSRFCLAAGGDGFGDRLTRSMRTGCVPVIIQPGVEMPLEDVLPYEDFSLRFGFDDIKVLHERLAAVDATEHARLRRGVLRYASAFNWHDEHGLAYEYVRYSLCRRAASVPCAHLRPRTLLRDSGRVTGIK